MTNDIAYYSHGTDSLVYYVIAILVYFIAFAWLWIRFPTSDYWEKLTALLTLCSRIITLALLASNISYWAILFMHSFTIILYVVFILFSIYPWRDMYIRTKTILSQEFCVVNEMSENSEQSNENSESANIPNLQAAPIPSLNQSQIIPVSEKSPAKKFSADYLNKLSESYTSRWYRYIIWQYSEYAIWCSILISLMIVMIKTDDLIRESVFYVYGAWVSFAIFIISLRLIYFYGTLLQSLSVQLSSPCENIGKILMGYSVILILDLLSTKFFGIANSAIMGISYVLELISILYGYYSFLQGLIYRERMFIQEIAHIGNNI